MLNKLIKKGNITEFENKLAGRLARGQLSFGNKIQLTEIKILTLINDLKYNEEYFQECENCRDKFSITILQNIDNSLYCENCISENFYSCENCGELIYNDDIHSFENSEYCGECYFEVRQKAYKEHKISNPLINKLTGIIINYDIYKIEFEIDRHRWNIESYARGNFRFGSWGANCWIDIGNCEADLLKAIDYNLGYNREKLTAIYLNEDTEIEL